MCVCIATEQKQHTRQHVAQKKNKNKYSTAEWNLDTKGSQYSHAHKFCPTTEATKHCETPILTRAAF